MKRLDITVTGKVQRVFFRACTKTKAEELDISGWCRNQENGSVYILAEGKQSNLDLFLKWCNQGPEFARVDKVEVKEGEPIESKGFKIIRD